MSKKQEPEDRLVLVEYMKNFLRVASAVSYEEYETMPDNVRAALIAASKELDAERVLLLAKALRSEEGLMQATAPLDGGDALVEYSLGQHIKQFVADRRNRVRA